MARVSRGFARRLRALLRERNLSQSDVARALRIHRSAIGHWTNGRKMPRHARLPELAELLGVTVGQLYGEG